MTNSNIKEESSFKDPDAGVFVENGVYIRKIYERYRPEYEKLMQSGLYENLTAAHLLVKHEEIRRGEDCIVIKPEQVFVSYPWEWCFSQLKDAALATLKIQQTALEFDMSLKDANCFNIQFLNNKPLLIDTSSFENYEEGSAWVAYRQFCENFIAPLALMAYTDLNLNGLFLMNINGIPLELTSKLLPFKTKFNLNLFTHIHLHCRMQNKYSDNSKKVTNIKISKMQLQNIIKNLQSTVESINLPKYETEWGDYYSFTNYKGYGTYDFVGFRNYVDLFQDSRVGKSYLFTFKFAIVSTIVTNVVSLILALGLNSKIKGKSALRGIYFIPNVLGGLVVGYIFSFIFTYILPTVGQKLGIGFLSSSMLSSESSAWLAIVFVACWQSVAMNTIIYISGLQTVPEDVYEAGSIDGATGWSKFKNLTFPLIIPFFSINMVLCMKNFLMVFDQIMALTKGGPAQSTESISYLIYNNGMSGGQFGFQSANAVIFFIVIVVISVAQMKFTGSKEEQL